MKTEPITKLENKNKVTSKDRFFLEYEDMKRVVVVCAGRRGGN